jgi:hypothetical protein
VEESERAKIRLDRLDPARNDQLNSRFHPAGDRAG